MITQEKFDELMIELTTEGWGKRDEPGELERVAEIQNLLKQQRDEDNYSTANQRDRIGRANEGWVGHHDMSGHGDDAEDVYDMWPQRTEDQLALEKGLEPFLDAMPAELRPVYRLTFDNSMSVRDIEREIGLTKSTVHRRLESIREYLKTKLVETFPEEEVTDDV